MYWARDQVGRLIEASAKAVFSFGLRCPTCDKPVFRRAGEHRSAHFAHYGYGAKPGCESYHPPSALDVTPARASAPTPAPTKAGADSKIATPTLRGGLFLISKKNGGPQLLLRLPQFDFADSVDGQIQLQTSLGVRHLVAESFRARSFVPLAPRVPLADVGGWGALSQVAESVRDVLSQFQSLSNFFSATDEGGRLVSPDEPLELGERYQYFGIAPLSPPPGHTGARVLRSAKELDWYVCEFQLPSDASDSDLEVIAPIERWLGRPVRAPAARIWAVDPPPHHVDPDGTLVYPVGTQAIKLRRSRECSSRIETYGQADRNEAIHWITATDGELRNFSTGDACIVIGDRIQVQLRVQECPLFMPDGIRIEASKGTFDLFATNTRDAFESFGECLVVCPSERVAQFVANASRQWRQSANTLVYDGLNLPQAVLDGENFGDVQPMLVSDQQLMPEVSPTHMWLEGVAKRIADGGLSQRIGTEAAGLSYPVSIGGRSASTEWFRVHRAYAEKLDK